MLSNVPKITQLLGGRYDSEALPSFYFIDLSPRTSGGGFLKPFKLTIVIKI